MIMTPSHDMRCRCHVCCIGRDDDTTHTMYLRYVVCWYRVVATQGVCTLVVYYTHSYSIVEAMGYVVPCVSRSPQLTAVS